MAEKPVSPISFWFSLFVITSGVIPYFSGGLIALVVWALPIYVFLKIDVTFKKKLIIFLANVFVCIIVIGLISGTKLDIRLF